MKTYRIKTQFSFNGYFYVNADNRAKAIAQVEQNTSLVLGGNINTSSDDIIQFEFDFHPVKRIDTYKTTVTRFNVSND
jgi:hypothetical protein